MRSTIRLPVSAAVFRSLTSAHKQMRRLFSCTVLNLVLQKELLFAIRLHFISSLNQFADYNFTNPFLLPYDMRVLYDRIRVSKAHVIIHKHM